MQVVGTLPQSCIATSESIGHSFRFATAAWNRPSAWIVTAPLAESS